MLAVKYNKIDNRKNKLRNANVGVTEAKVRIVKRKISEICSKRGQRSLRYTLCVGAYVQKKWQIIKKDHFWKNNENQRIPYASIKKQFFLLTLSTVHFYILFCFIPGRGNAESGSEGRSPRAASGSGTEAHHVVKWWWYFQAYS